MSHLPGAIPLNTIFQMLLVVLIGQGISRAWQLSAEPAGSGSGAWGSAMGTTRFLLMACYLVAYVPEQDSRFGEVVLVVVSLTVANVLTVPCRFGVAGLAILFRSVRRAWGVYRNRRVTDAGVAF
jgi:hypothetical protein